MITTSSRSARPSRRGRGPWRTLLAAAALAAVFAVGIALGQALAEDTLPEEAVTRTRTIVPVAATRVTVTVTITETSP